MLGVICEFVGSVRYADDMALLALSPSALRLFPNIICEDFARSHGLKFNATKTDLANLPVLFN